MITKVQFRNIINTCLIEYIDIAIKLLLYLFTLKEKSQTDEN